MNNYPEKKSVEKCLLQIEEKLGWGSAELWHNEVFIELSEKIQEATDVLLSPTTLKRIWGKVNYDSAPSINTLNTLSQFAGYTNWRDFKIKLKLPRKTKPKRQSISNLGIIITSAACLTLLFISFFSLVGVDQDIPLPIVEQIEFSSRPVSEGLPNSVVFDFQLKGIQSDSIYIQQFWDPARTIKIRADQQQATGIYYLPGYFRSKLLVDGKIIKEHDLFIKTNGWAGTIDYQPVPKYIQAEQSVKNGLSFPATIIEEIAGNQNPVTATFHLVEDFRDISGDDFSLETSIRNVYREKWAVCQTARIVVLGTEGAMIIPFSIPGCVSDIGLMLNDVYLSGKENDLSAFGVDFSDYRAIKINVQDKQVEVLVDDKQIYASRYHETVGRLVGIRFRFLGAGEVGHLNIINVKGQNILGNK